MTRFCRNNRPGQPGWKDQSAEGVKAYLTQLPGSDVVVSQQRYVTCRVLLLDPRNENEKEIKMQDRCRIGTYAVLVKRSFAWASFRNGGASGPFAGMKQVLLGNAKPRGASTSLRYARRDRGDDCEMNLGPVWAQKEARLDWDHA